MIPDSPYYVDDRGDLRFREHAGQARMMRSTARFVLVLAGTQSGKTVSGPWWLLRELQHPEKGGPGDYLVAAPTYPLMKKKVLPEFRDLFERRLRLGTYNVSDKLFTFSASGQEMLFGSVSETPTRIFFGHAQDPDSLESATAKAAWLDEAGQKKFKYGSWQAIQRRLSIYEGRVLITTTPYTLGWLKSELHDRADEADVDLIQFASIMNPVFPEEEYRRMQRILPTWKFNMMYRGRFERPAGMIYDVFDRHVHLVPRFRIPDDWPRFIGLDFGGSNTAGVFVAREPGTNRHVLYRSYHAGQRTAAAHTENLLDAEPMQPMAAGGAPSEGQWRQEFREAGLSVREPVVSDVEVGINRVYAMLKAHPRLNGSGPYIEIMDDVLAVIDEIESYARVLDDEDEPTEKIEDKELYHHLDALRYITTWLRDDAAIDDIPVASVNPY